MVLITDDRDGGGVRVRQLQLQQHQQQKVGGNVSQVHPTIEEEPPSNSEDDYPSEDGDLMKRRTNSKKWTSTTWMMVAASRVLHQQRVHRPDHDPTRVKEEQVKESDKNNRIGLLVACYQGYVDVVIALCQCPYLDVNWQDSEGNTALITAAQAGHITITNYLLNYYSGLDIERRNCHGFTALMKAAMQGRVECVRSLMMAGAALNAKDFGRHFTARDWALFTGRYETAWVMTRLMERPFPNQFCESYSLEWPPLTIANVTNPEEEGVIDHMVSITTAMRSPAIAVACHTVCPDSPPSVGKRHYAVPEIIRQQRAKELRSVNPDRADGHLKLFQNSRITLVAKNSADRRASLQPQSLVPRQRSSSLGLGAYNEALELRRTSLLPVHMVLRRSSVRPGFSIPKLRVSKAPAPTYEPEKVRRKSSAKDGGGHLLQIPKWRYKELKEERKKAEEAERRRLEAITKRHLAAGKRK
ncbi:unnamed protein product [Pleuronectes platessa]|uniref:Ankyrin repeat domain 33ba n=1 Tax=Pleuronectes platessa TaxID=8262 RepID=A0A9N7VAS4_PLEPL|nr:unnamed protein product [Pleuronectes platessa]